MDVDLSQALRILRRTPDVLRALLQNLPTDWIDAKEGEGTWSPFDVLGHLIHGERTDWIARARIILEKGESQAFESFDRFAQFEASKGKTLDELLHTFAGLRRENIRHLEDLEVSPHDLLKTGMHPELGKVTLGELIATWVAHDLDHIVQISRIMASRYKDAVGPWRAFLSVLK